MAALGLCVSTQPLFIHSEKGWLHRRLGAERARHVYPLRALLDGGVRVGGASDAPVESTDVLHAIQCCVTREGFETHQAIAPLEALDSTRATPRTSSSRRREKGTPRRRQAGGPARCSTASPLAVPPDRIAGAARAAHRGRRARHPRRAHGEPAHDRAFARRVLLPILRRGPHARSCAAARRRRGRSARSQPPSAARPGRRAAVPRRRALRRAGRAPRALRRLGHARRRGLLRLGHPDLPAARRSRAAAVRRTSRSCWCTR